MKKPDFFIVGAPKCATTALYSYLKEHPSVFMPEEKKEPHYFADELSDFFVYTRDEAEYLSLFAGAEDGQKCGEASVMYLQSETALQKALKYNPQAKFIAMVRNPVDAVISMHRQNIKSGHEDQLEFLEAWKLQAARKKGKAVPKNCTDPGMLQYGDLLALGSQLERFLKTVPQEQRMVIVYDDFKADTKNIYNNVLNFLGVDAAFKQDFPVVNPTTGHMSRLFEKRVAKIKYAGMLVIGPVLYFFHRCYIYWLRPVLKPDYQPASLPKPPEEVYEMLEEHFTPEIRKLETLLDRSFAHWFQHGKAESL